MDYEILYFMCNLLPYVGLFIIFKSIIKVRPGQRIIVWKRFGANAGRVRVLDAGLHHVNLLSWARFGQGPFEGLIRDNACPMPLSTVFIDPDRVEIMSKDKVPGTANVSVELQVLDWDASDVIGVNVPFRTRASITVNQWVSRLLSDLEAANLCSYADVVTCLNDCANLKDLNLRLRECFLEAKRVSVDPSGIDLHKEYSMTVGKAIQNMRHITLQRQEAQASQEAMERKLQLQQMETQAQCDVMRMKSLVERDVEKAKANALADRVRALIAAGLSPHQVSNVLVAEVSVVGLTKAEKVFVGMPQGLLGLRGIDHIYDAPSSDAIRHSDHETYEKV